MGTVAERHKYILDRVNKEGHVTVLKLSEELLVSEVTIRKDLKYLEEKKMLSRKHGSARNLLTIIPDRHIDIKEKMKIEEKARIARAASELLEKNDKIIIASGTTALAFANTISNIVLPMAVITPSVKVSLALCNNPNIEIVQLGGVIRKNAASVIGNDADYMLTKISCNKLFFGIDGLDINYGLTTSSMLETPIHEHMFKSSQKKILLTDSSKFGLRSFSKICDVNEIDQIITDTDAPQDMVNYLTEIGIEVTLV
ncbi:MAG: DeoR/GlpR family DNA-binding transcription regulator [Tannerellaceae bacterium]|jgi:DeoR family transcriptional regulator of aga operon|nr:DeoR/GlpR family DNA-binding transcription regulator [Tannerellaceae bacterium]